MPVAAVDTFTVLGLVLRLSPWTCRQVVDTVASLKQLLATHPAASPVPSPISSPARRRPARSTGSPSASGHSTPSAAGSGSSARSAARAAAAKVPAQLLVLCHSRMSHLMQTPPAAQDLPNCSIMMQFNILSGALSTVYQTLVFCRQFDYDALGVRLASGRAGPPPPLANRSGRSRSRSGDNGSRAAAAAAGAAATRGALAANGSSPSRHRASGGSTKSAPRAAKSPEPWNDDFGTAED